MHPQAMLYSVPPRGLREERLKDIHLKPVHALVKEGREIKGVNVHCHGNDRECLEYGVPEQSAEKGGTVDQ